MLDGPDREAARRAMEAMLQMTKIDVAKLREAYEGVPDTRPREAGSSSFGVDLGGGRIRLTEDDLAGIAVAASGPGTGPVHPLFAVE